jgi:hypothetical protein
VELIPGGTRIAVDNVNKYRYLDALAQHRLVNSVRDQVDAFIHGLAELVPDNLLSIFDENELEVRTLIGLSHKIELILDVLYLN